jgi:hypothetical protein
VRRRALDSTVLNDAVVTQDTITQLAECLQPKSYNFYVGRAGLEPATNGL